MNPTIENKIPTTYLPDDWRESGALKFNCSANQIERVVYGKAPLNKRNNEIFDYMLTLAEEGKTEWERKEQERSERLKALAQTP